MVVGAMQPNYYVFNIQCFYQDYLPFMYISLVSIHQPIWLGIFGYNWSQTLLQVLKHTNPYTSSRDQPQGLFFYLNWLLYPIKSHNLMLLTIMLFENILCLNSVNMLKRSNKDCMLYIILCLCMFPIWIKLDAPVGSVYLQWGSETIPLKLISINQNIAARIQPEVWKTF